MPNHPVAAIVCALVAALLIAVAAVAQQRAAAAVPEGASLVANLVRSPRWWAGIVGDLGGYGMQVVALSFGAVLLVQPILVSALVFALPLSARMNGRRITGRAAATAAVLVVALTVFLVVGRPTPGNNAAPLREWLPPLTILLALVAAATLAGLRAAAPNARALALGAAAGSLFGLSAALTDYVVTLFGRGPGAVVAGWQTWALLAAGLTGFYLQQRAFHAGPLSSSLPAATVAEPLAAAFLGLTALDEHLRTDAAGLVVVGLAVAVMCWTAVALAREQAAPGA
ncbi:DMT family transporter [Nocardia thailandica]|uniref:DMT family transporter n=1 Tax=Nocardia thailandica TaxID=257275 RepID=UPI0002F65264|nr:DMT family transporter [Nocardia thailandica]